MIQIIETPYIVEQFRRPRSRKKRIRAKWAKRPENWRPDLRRVLMIDGKIYCHPVMAAQIRKAQSTGFHL